MADKSLQPSIGLLTWDAEGNNVSSSIYFSRRAHWPGGASGVTIGRGYDMKERRKEKIEADLIAAGLSKADAEILAKGAQLDKENAKKFIDQEDVRKIVISEEQQVKLFENMYSWYWSDARRLCMKSDVENKYGACNWSTFNPIITDLIADLRYRGDYARGHREKIQKDLLSGDIDKIISALEYLQKSYAIPIDRHNRRIKFLRSGVAK